MRLAAFSFLALAVLSACAAPYDPSAARVLAPQGRPDISGLGVPVIEATASGEELALVTAILTDLQRRSFATGREHCGYIGLGPSGRWTASSIVAGDEAACPLPPAPPTMRVAASFHTHSTYSPFYASEWPTTQDVATDRASGIDGYISTPGGRLWHVDTDTMTVRQLCGRGCLPQDPDYVGAEDGPLRSVMTYEQLQAWEWSIGGV